MFWKAAIALSVVFIVAAAQAQTLSTLYSFKGGKEGQLPGPGVIRDEAGNLYSTTGYGGAFGWGTVFKLSPSGKETVLYSFTGKRDGALPDSRLLRDKAGNFFGAAAGGGDPSCSAATPPGCGVIFKLEAATHKLVVLYTFKGPPSDGEVPLGDLIRDEEGNFYGGTELGGTSNSGTIFKLDPTGKETVLYSFKGGMEVPTVRIPMGSYGTGTATCTAPHPSGPVAAESFSRWIPAAVRPSSTFSPPTRTSRHLWQVWYGIAPATCMGPPAAGALFSEELRSSSTRATS